MSPNTTMFTITGGPSQEMLFDAYKYAFDEYNDFTVTFHGSLECSDGRVVAYQELKARIVGLQYTRREKGWNIVKFEIWTKGYLTSAGSYWTGPRQGEITLVHRPRKH